MILALLFRIVCGDYQNFFQTNLYLKYFIESQWITGKQNYLIGFPSLSTLPLVVHNLLNSLNLFEYHLAKFIKVHQLLEQF